MTLREAMAAVRTNPKDAMAWSALGDTLAQEKQLEKARESYQRALQLDPLCAAAQAGLAATLMQAAGEPPAVPPVEVEPPRPTLSFLPSRAEPVGSEQAGLPAARATAQRRARQAVPPWPEKPGRGRMVVGLFLVLFLPSVCLCAGFLALARLI